MKKVFLFFFLFPVLAYAQDLGYDITKVDDTTFIVKDRLIENEDADTLKTFEEAFQISYNAAHQHAHRAGLGMARFQVENSEFNKARAAHDLLFPDSLYWDANDTIIGPRLVGNYVVRIGGVPKDASIFINPSGKVRLKDDPPNTAAANFQIRSFNNLKLLAGYEGEVIDLYRRQGTNVWIGEKSDGTKFRLRRKK